MSTEPPEVPRRRRPLTVLLAVAVAGGGAFLGWFLTSGATRLPPTRRTVSAPAVVVEDRLAAAREAFLHEPTLANSRSYLQQLNDYLQRNQDYQTPALSEAAVRLLPISRFVPYLADEFRAELESRLFTSADAYYLTMCAFFADAAHALPLDGLSDRERAQVCFQWVIRQMMLQEEPPYYFLEQALRRGRGTDMTRMFVFVATLERLGISSSVFTCGDSKDKAFHKFVGVLAEGNIYLFDTRLGIPVPGGDPHVIPTLAQLEEHPEWLQPLSEETGIAFDLVMRDIHPTWQMHAAAGRMRFLEEQLAPPYPFRLATDAVAIHEQWKKAARKPLLVSHSIGWFTTAPPAYSWALFSTVQADEKRTPQPKEPPPSRAFRASLVPWNKLPAILQEVGRDSESGGRLRTLFAAPFESFFLKPGGPRDLLLRGRLEEAARRLVELHDQLLDFQRQASAMPDLKATVATWCEAVHQADTEKLAAERATQAGDLHATEQLKKSQEQLQLLWSKERIAPVLHLLHASAAEPLSIEVAYQLALCKHEQAERLQIPLDHRQDGNASAARDAWRSAAERWRTFLEEHPQAPGEGSARLLAARALEMIGDRAGALALVQDPPAHLQAWDRRACLYRARLLKAAK